MTYEGLQNILKVMLSGDKTIPKDNTLLLAMLEMAYIEIASKCTALKLLTSNPADRIIREGFSGTYVRMPSLPENPTDELDIDMELVPAVARIIASYITKDNIKTHIALADEIIRLYESKVRAFMLNQEQKGKFTDVPSTDVFGSDGVGITSTGV